MRGRWLQGILAVLIIFALVGISHIPSMAFEPANVVAINCTVKHGQVLDSSPIALQGRARALLGAPATCSNAQIEVIVRDAGDYLDALTTIDSLQLGRVGLGLLSAYEMTVDLLVQTVTYEVASPYYAAAVALGNALVAAAATTQLTATDAIFLYGLAQFDNPADPTASAYYAPARNAVTAFRSNAAFDTAAELHAFYQDEVTQGADAKQATIYSMASWVEAGNLFNTPGNKAWADEIAAYLVANCQDDAGGFFFEVVGSTYLVRTAGHAKAVEVLKRFYDTTYDTQLKQGLAYLRALQSLEPVTANDDTNGLFTWGATTNADDTITPWNNYVVQDQCNAISAMAYNLQTTWSNFNANKGPYWGSMALIDDMMNAGGTAFEDDTLGVRADFNGDALWALYTSCKEGDVTKSGQIVSYDALLTLRASVGQHFGLYTTDAGTNYFASGPAVVAAFRNRSANNRITAGDATTLLKASVGNPDNGLETFLD